MKILMGVDDSKSANDVVKTMAKQFRAEGTEVRVLHVLQPIAFETAPQMHPAYAPELQEEIEPANALVNRVADELKGVGFKADSTVQIGDVRETILDLAAEWHADLIVLGSHGQRGLKRFLMGSVAESVARHAGCSVEVVRLTASA